MGTNIGWAISDALLLFEDSFVFGCGFEKFQTIYVDDY